MIAKVFAVLFVVAGGAVADVGLRKPMAGVDPNTLSCDPLGQVFLLLPHFTDCSKFYMCAHGEEVLFHCSGGLIFDFELQGCNWEWATPCITRDPPGGGGGGGEGENSKESSEQRSDSSGDRSDSSEQRPDSSGDQSDSSEQRPDSSGDRSDSSEPRPDSSEERPDSSGDRPDSSEQRPDSSDGRSDSSEQRPDSSEQRPDSSEERSGSSEEPPESSEESEGSGDFGSGDGLGEIEWIESEPQPEILGPQALLSLASQEAKDHEALMALTEFSVNLDCTRAETATRQEAYRGDCQRYWRCADGVVQAVYCSDGLFFNGKTSQCDFEANVRCEINHDYELEGEFLIYKK